MARQHLLLANIVEASVSCGTCNIQRHSTPCFSYDDESLLQAKKNLVKHVIGWFHERNLINQDPAHDFALEMSIYDIIMQCEFADDLCHIGWHTYSIEMIYTWQETG
jgi:hypothetical protein